MDASMSTATFAFCIGLIPKMFALIAEQSSLKSKRKMVGLKLISISQIKMEKEYF